MKLKNILIAALLLVTSAIQAQMVIPFDKDVRTGKLPNGLTYYIRYNNWPEHRANFYIAQKVGSIQEEESQRGLAHFLEHMAFNGSDNFKGNSLIEWCRSIGVEFGGDLNAFTSIDKTVYNIDNVPTTRQSALDSCLLILRDWSAGLSLEQEEIDKERGVIHEEWRLRTSASSRMFERNLPALYPGSKYGLRYPIGLMSVVDNFKRKELVDYYHKWYHPSHQGIIVVGDVDVDHVEAEIKKLFAGIKNPENEAPIVDEKVPDTAEPIVIIDKDKEYQASSVELMMKHDVYPDSLKGRLDYFVYQFALGAANSMLSQRLAEAAQKENCPYVEAGAGYGDYIFAKTKDAFELSATPKDMSLVAPALKAVAVEARRAAEFGFTATEYDRYKESFMSSLDKMYSNKDKRYNSQFYNECLAHFLESEPMPGIDYEYQAYKQIVPAIPVEAVNEVMKELFLKNDSNIVILNFNNEKEGNVYPTKELLVKALNEARAENISAYVDNVKNEPILSKLPKAGKIKSEKKNDKFGYTELTLSNGVRVILKKTDYKKDQVILTGRGNGGMSLYGLNDYVNVNMFNSVIGASGLGNFSNTELRKALAGKIASAGISMGAKYMNASGNSTPKDVETMLQLLYLHFTNIKKDEESYNNLIKSTEISLKNRNLSPEVAFQDSVTGTLYDHNPYVAPITLERLGEVSYDRILQIAKENTASAKDWTFTIIGNYDEKTIRPLICQYLGALPTKKKIAKGHRLADMTNKNVDNIFNRKMETPKANCLKIWTNNKMVWNQEREIQASIAGEILSMVYLKQIREEASAAYSCGAQGAFGYDEDGSRAYVLASCPMKPEKKELAMKIMDDEVPNLAEKCDAEMLDKVKKAMVKQLDDALKTNGYWLSIITAYDRYGFDLNSNNKTLIESQTPEKISAFMKEFLKNANKITIAMLPEEAK